MRLGLAVLRIVVGLVFVGHGTQKLFGWFGGGGPEGTGQFFESVGMRPGKQNAVASGVSETAGGALLALGLATPLATAALSGTMATALWTVHKDNGPWVTAGGYEYNLTLLAIFFALADLGPGAWSLDEALEIDHSGPRWALAQLGAGIAGTAAVLRRAGRQPGAAAG